MQLLRIALKNWRGVESREIQFADGVTLIEGPNEIGKSTIVEALLTLIRELDSSKKQGVKAVMPVGHDVGSSVEAEIRCGDYHFVYSKTYNKSTATSLDILAPKKEQLTGREAHERVDQILDDTVDLALWYALLARQGNSIAAAELRDSAGLAQALDRAAGSTDSGHEDTDLYEAVEAEYQKYFTLKTGKSRFASLEKEVEQARAERDAASGALTEVERTVADQERIQADVRRRQQSQPELEARVTEHAASWKAVGKLKQDLELKVSQLEAATEQFAAAQKVSDDRSALIEAIGEDEDALAKLTKELEPLQRRADELKRKSDSATLVAEDRRKRRNGARKQEETVRDDAAYLGDLEQLASAEKRLQSHKQLSAQLQSASQTVNQVKIDDKGLEKLRELDRTLDVARQKRDLAATKVIVTAERALELEIDNESLSLKSDETAERTVAAGLDIHLPGVASVRIAPPHSAAELESEVSEAEEKFRTTLERYGVGSLEEAISRNEARRSALQQVRQLKSKLEEILGGETPEEIDERIRSLRERTESYRDQRTTAMDLPTNASEVREVLVSAQQSLKAAEKAVEDSREQEKALRNEQVEADSHLREAGQSVVTLNAMLAEKKARLAKARKDATDQVVEETIQERSASLNKLEAGKQEILRQLDELAADTVETLYENATDSFERGKRELAEAERNLAVLNDRLEQAQADGRFETLEAAEREVEELERQLAATRRRALAAERLWRTMNTYRDAARQAYVRPLKEAIERLGQIVFGPTFEVVIGDDWTLESRVLDGKTLPFDDLSVGAREQLGILTRLAAGQIVATEGGVPLIIDDALGFSDPSRLDTMGAAISAAGKNCQIVILTCTPGRFSNVGSATTVQF